MSVLQAAATLLASKNATVWTPQMRSECVSTAMALQAEIDERSPKPVTLAEVRAWRSGTPYDLAS